MRRRLFAQFSTAPAAFRDRLLLVATTERACNLLRLPPLPPAHLVPKLTSGAWCGNVSSEHTFRRTQFALLPGGDTPGTRREVEAMQFGAIPITLVDRVWADALPFQ